MDAIGSEIGLKMRSAIKAKLTELGCYIDDELPDYVMVMVANKRTRSQMEEDLNLFLSSNTSSFVTWLYQVLEKLQEVTINTPPAETSASSKDRIRSVSKEPKVKERKIKDKKGKVKEKHKKNDVSKKSRKKDKEKVHHKKGDKKLQKHKKKTKKTKLIRPNVPPLLMNLERESEPSITDVFAGQILKNHGENLEHLKDNDKEVKPVLQELKRVILPIIDPSTISVEPVEEVLAPVAIDTSKGTGEAPSDQVQEMNKIEEKIHDLRRKLAKQLNSMSDDEDFLSISAGPDELLPELADDVFQEISAARSIEVRTSPTDKEVEIIPSPIEPAINSNEAVIPADPEPPQIELRLPKRSVREKLSVREEPKIISDSNKSESKSKREDQKRITEPTKEQSRKSQANSQSNSSTIPESDTTSKQSRKTAKRSRRETEKSRRTPTQDKDSGKDNYEPATKRKSPNSPVRASPASVVSVRPRARARQPASQLLFRAVAEAQKSLLNIPPKKEVELPLKRAVRSSGNTNPRLTILVSGSQEKRRVLQPDEATTRRDNHERKRSSDSEREKSPVAPAFPAPLITRFINTDYVPKLLLSDEADVDADSAIVKREDIHKAKLATEEGPVFLVTLEGLDPNQFLSKKLQSEGIDSGTLLSKGNRKRINTENQVARAEPITPDEAEKSDSWRSSYKKRLSDTSEESDTQVIIKPDEKRKTLEERRKGVEDKRNSEEKKNSVEEALVKEEKEEETPPVKKRRTRSPIVFDEKSDRIDKAERERRARTLSNGSDSNTVVTTAAATKYDSLPSLSTAAAERKTACRTFPLCRFGAKCLFAHPPCKFASACTRRNCMYAHQPTPPPPPPPGPYIASHVVPAPNYKSIKAPPAVVGMCKYYPNCVNPGCHYYHPKPCRFGTACLNRQECNFYHHDAPANKWRSAV